MRSEDLYTTLINGGELVTKSGHQIYFDPKHSKIICTHQGKVYEFEDVRDLAIFFFFQGVTIEHKYKHLQRNDWYVLTVDAVQAVVPSKQLAVNYCVKINQDRRANLGVTKVDTSIYQYSGPRNIRNYYIGLREPLIQFGFEKQIRAWHANEERKRTFV